jgi:hypothetical protein
MFFRIRLFHVRHRPHALRRRMRVLRVAALPEHAS